MHKLFLWDVEELRDLSASEKGKRITAAVKAYRTDFPVNKLKALIMVALWVLLPCILILIYLNVSASVAWGVISTFALNFKQAKIEAPLVRKYFHKNDNQI